MTFGQFIKNQREAKNWTQPEAAAQIGIEQSYLSKLENNKAVPSPESFDKLMQAYEFDMAAVGQQVTDTELHKLKDIAQVRDLIVNHKKRSERTRRSWLLAGLLALMVGSALTAYGTVIKDAKVGTFLYESKGWIKQGNRRFCLPKCLSIGALSLACKTWHTGSTSGSIHCLPGWTTSKFDPPNTWARIMTSRRRESCVALPL
ncbi:helix-turn-helix domain-containing protein [Microbulbifer taiwanensis]|uniref:helix-turn-helix domain-containing protein n=1 Tax=Microbulbifer taiwanensis TaxID=986746 RepID=UPI003618D432